MASQDLRCEPGTQLKYPGSKERHISPVKLLFRMMFQLTERKRSAELIASRCQRDPYLNFLIGPSKPYRKGRRGDSQAISDSDNYHKNHSERVTRILKIFKTRSSDARTCWLTRLWAAREYLFLWSISMKISFSLLTNMQRRRYVWHQTIFIPITVKSDNINFGNRRDHLWNPDLGEKAH